MVGAVELPDTVIAIELRYESLEDLPWDKICDLGKNILAFVHILRDCTLKATNSFQIAVVKELI